MKRFVKKLLSCICALALCLSFVPTFSVADEIIEPTYVTYDNLKYRVEENNTVTLVKEKEGTAWSDYTGNITVPASFTETKDDSSKTYIVTSIDVQAFQFSSVTSVTLPDSVTTIPDNAFFGCTSLTSITFGNAVTSIGSSAFANCSALSSLTIPNTVKRIGRCAFARLGAQSLVIPASVTNTVDAGLLGYEHLSGVTFEEGSPYKIDQGVVYKGTELNVACDRSITTYSVLEGTTKINDGAFTAANQEGVQACMDLASVTLPDSVQEIGKNAFKACSALTSVNLPSGLTEIGESAFASTALTKVIIPEGVKEIPQKAFNNVKTLKTIVIPSSVISIGEKAFSGLQDNSRPQETMIIMQRATAPSMEQAFGTSGPVHVTVVVPAGSEESYKETILKKHVTTTEGGSETTKPGISYKLEVNENAALKSSGENNNAQIGTAVVPTDWMLNVEPSVNDVVTISRDEGTGAITATATNVGTVAVKFSIQKDDIILAEDTCTITVTAATVDVSSVTLDQTSLSLFTNKDPKTAQLTATVKPDNATNKAVTWSSSNENAAKVDQKGNVTAVGDGTAIITATAGGKSASCTVKVSTYTAPVVSNPITVPSVAGGKVAVSPNPAAKGDTVTLTVTPDKGYQLSSLTVTDGSGNKVQLTDKGNGTYTFTMPDSKVKVNASFSKIVVKDPVKDCPQDKTCPAVAFSDVPAKQWYHDGVHYCVANKLMVGIGDNMFAPNTNLSRAMLVSVLYRMDGSPAVGAPTFADVPANQWYSKAVAWAAEKKIVAGIGNNLYAPDQDITRQDMSAILYRYAQYKGADMKQLNDLTAFGDAGSISSYAKAPVQWCVAHGIISGKPGKVLDPKGNASRAEVATVLYRYCESVTK